MPERVLWHDRRMRRLLGFLAVLGLLVVAAGIYLAWTIQRSVPSSAGVALSLPSGGATAAPTTIVIEFDALGVPTIRGADEMAVAWGQGWAHARDRRFQMELLRRTAAGRLSELVGRSALSSDRFFRTLGFAAVADSAMAALGPRRRALFQAYADGVNAWDAAHPAPPEFLLLGVAPEPWRPRDVGLVSLLMQQDQCWEAAGDERDREIMERALSPALVDFLLPVVTPWDAPLVAGEAPAIPPLPAATDVDLRAPRVGVRAPRPGSTALAFGPRVERDGARGSNGWAVSGARTRSGRPLLANDPHMTLRVPALWHRQRLEFADGAGAPAVTGATLPGVPGVVLGSNAAVAWGATNIQGDFVDLVRCVPADPETLTYAGPAGPEPFGRRREIILVKGAAAETLFVRTTRFGPVMARSQAAGGGLLAAQWTTLDPATLDTDLFPMNRATSLEAFLAALGQYRGPQLSFVAADSAGRIGWKVGGLVPRRAAGAFDRVRDATDPGAAWTGYVAWDSIPSLVDPPDGMIFSANQRMVGGRAWGILGGSIGAPWRARRIAAVLGAREDFAASDMSALQNDLDASYLEPTAEAIERALAALPAAERAADDTLTRIAAILAGREGRADTTSVAQAYLVQARNALRQALVDPLVAPCAGVDSAFVYTWPLADEVVRRLLEARAPHLLDPRFADYDALVRHAARRGAATLGARAPELPFDRIPWGRINRGDVAHPLGAVSPLLARLLDQPRPAFAGGAHVVRVMQPRHGPSFRMVADLADRAASTFELPGGQSGHFRSPHYGDGFAAWWAGRPSPLEPGPPVERAPVAAKRRPRCARLRRPARSARTRKVQGGP